MSEIDNPHVDLEDGSAVEVRLNGERMDFRDEHDGAFVVDADYDDGRMIVTVGGDGVGVELTGPNEWEEWDLFDCNLVKETETKKVYVPPEGSGYDFEIVIHRERPEPTSPQEVEADE